MNDRPNWTDPLRPDDVTSARMRRAIAAAAEPLLAARREDWWDVASGWATLLIPIAAVLTLVFAGIAVRNQYSTVRFASSAGTSAGVDVVGSVSEGTVPAGFSERSEDDLDVVFAAIREADALERSPGSKGP